jgi:hypothetical protein
MLLLGKISLRCSFDVGLDISKVFSGAEILVFNRPLVPLSLPIFYAELQHKRIFSSIGAKLEVLFL